MSIFAFFHSTHDLHKLKKACSQQRSNAVRSMHYTMQLNSKIYSLTLVWHYTVRALFCLYGAVTSGQHGPNFIPGAVSSHPIQIYPKNLNGGKADGSYHQL